MTDWAALEPFFQELQHRAVRRRREPGALAARPLGAGIGAERGPGLALHPHDLRHPGRRPGRGVPVFCAGSGAPGSALRPRPQREAAGSVPTSRELSRGALRRVSALGAPGLGDLPGRKYRRSKPRSRPSSSSTPPPSGAMTVTLDGEELTLPQRRRPPQKP
ncbi:MAG: hypothetical protein WKG07_15325 [Hymenobacter sp.]